MKGSWKPTALLIGPGGLKGFIYLGALRCLDTHGMLDNITSYTGISVGSIISLLLICGYSVDEIIRIANKSKFTGNLINSLARLFSLSNLLPDQDIIDTIESKVMEKFGDIPTMKELYDKTNIDFTAVSFNDDTWESMFFNHKTHPDMLVTHAVSAAIGVPGLITRTEYKDDICSDAAPSNPYPVEYYMNTNHEVLGLYIENTAPRRINRFKGLGSELLMTIKTYESMISYFQWKEYKKSLNLTKNCKNIRHIKLKCSDVISLDTNIDTEKKAKLLLLGWTGADNFMNTEC